MNYLDTEIRLFKYNISDALFSAVRPATNYISAQEISQRLMAGVEGIDVPNLSEELKSTVNDIKREADEDCSMEQAESLIRMRVREVRRCTLLKEGCTILNIGWSNGRLYHTHKDNLIMIPTNTSSISWLDLAEFSLNFIETFPSCNHFLMPFKAKSQQPRYEYHLETRQQEIRTEYACRYYTIYYFKQIERCMKLEKTFSTIAALIQMWDNSMFIRYINSADNKLFRSNPEFHLRIFPRLLIQHCNDSKIIVSYFIIMTYNFSSDDDFVIKSIVKFMKLPYLHFFVMHIMNVLRIHPQPSNFQQWMTTYLGLVNKAFTLGKNKILELLLGIGWPHEFFSTGPTLPSESDRPAFSHVDMLSFVKAAITLSKETKRPSNLTQSIRLFWRSLKYPYISHDDLTHLVQYINNSENHASVSFEANRPTVSPLLVFYPRDCLATYQPRSLLHLSRCKIREIICMMYVDVLPLPNHLKDYLWLKY